MLVNSETKYVLLASQYCEGSSRPAVARTQFEMATEHNGQTGVVTVASSQGLRHCPWKRCAQGMSCVSTRPRRQKGHRALVTVGSVRARFGGRNEGAGASRTKSSNKPPSVG